MRASEFYAAGAHSLLVGLVSTVTVTTAYPASTRSAAGTAVSTNYPAGMSACEAAGLAGDAATGCPRAGTTECVCGEEGDDV